MATGTTKSKPTLHLVRERADIPVFQLKIELPEVKPQVWRRVVVPTRVRLSSLHDAIQIVMGWQGYHLHEFQFGREIFGVPDPEQELGRKVEDETRVNLEDLIRIPKLNFGYLYDFGDSWQHIVTVEKVALHDGGALPVCIGGKRNFVPEDCGAPPGYSRLLRILKKPEHPEYRDMRRWVGPSYDPERFDIEGINRRLAKVRV